MSPGLPPAIAGCIDACRRCDTLIGLAGGDRAPSGSYSLIGPHVRHCLDHLRCFLRGLAAGVVDYDARDREVVVEIDPRLARERLATVVEDLRALDPHRLGRPLRVRQSAALGAAPITVDSNLERELVFLSGHTIHHLAIMAILVRGRGLAIPEDLGIAFSTAAHMDVVDTGAT
jgi:hypothetical protein